jgi:c-di-GMP-binding flagellar brake protein YcgR
LTTPPDLPPALVTYVLPHLSFAATAVETCWIEVGPERMPGSFGHPDTESRTLPVRFDRNAAALPFVPDAGTAIRVSYEAQGEAYAWTSTVVGTDDPTAVRCSLPDQVERQDRRAAPRIRVLGRAGISLDIRMGGEGERRVSLVDLSTGGVALLAPKGKLSQGDQLLGRMLLADDDAIRIVLEVVGTRDGPDADALVHCLFASITDMSRQRIAEEVYGELRSDK